jgi:sugar phosphate isomerase/epimerase
MVVACSTTGFTRMPLPGALRAIRELGFEYVDLLAIEGRAHISIEYLDDGKNDVIQDILAMRAKLAEHGWR